MTPREKINGFIRGAAGAPMPSMPILMRLAAKHAGVKYKDFCLDAEAHCRASIKCAEDFRSDWVNVMSDPYCEAEAFGVPVTYPEDNLPVGESHLSIEDLGRLKLCDMSHHRMRGRLEQIKTFGKLGGGFLICGWVEGPAAEYCDLRGMGDAFLDFYDNPDIVRKTMSLIVENAKLFITEQVKAGARCIGIGDAACSQTGNELYREFAFEGEKEMVRHIHSLGALAKLHICGDTTAIIPGMIETGADIVDADHQVKNLEKFVPLLSKGQVLCGNLDPVAMIQNGTPELIRNAARDLAEKCRGKLIISAGCEITPDTPAENILAMAP
jgi:MtaA/CmuA family methyltransferase